MSYHIAYDKANISYTCIDLKYLKHTPIPVCPDSCSGCTYSGGIFKCTSCKDSSYTSTPDLRGICKGKCYKYFCYMTANIMDSMVD